MLLAGDVGGTKTLLGLFEPGERRPRAVAVRAYPTNDYDSFGALLEAFARDLGRPLRIDAAAVGVAGPVVAGRAALTNVEWDVSAGGIARQLGTPAVALLNDLQAMAASVETLTPEEIAVLQAGEPTPDGNGAIIAAGTGLGQAYLHRIDGRFVPVASEGGHADFAARTDREIDLVRMLRARLGRVEVEQVLSGPGLVNLHQLTHRTTPCRVVADTSSDDAPAAISESALARRCAGCVEALEMFVEAYGAEAGNLALRGLATAGVWVGGGIAPKIRPALETGRFMAAFRDKTPMADLLARMPVYVILSEQAALLGAAVHAAGMARSDGRLRPA